MSDNKHRTEPRKIGYASDGSSYDEESGEVLHDVNDSSGFLKMFTDNLWKVGLIGNVKVRVLVYLIKHMNRKNNICKATQGVISEDLGVSRRHISDSIGEIEQVGLVVAQRGHFYINPEFVWVGTEMQRRKAMNIYQKKYNEKFK